jgi:protein-S-isoprenylcysteine O-methyltransferase Ste14
MPRQFALWFLIVYAVARFFETFSKRKKSAGRIFAFYTLPLIVVSYVAVYLSAFWQYSRGNDWVPSGGLALAGIGTMLISVIGRAWAIRSLGPYHSIQIEIRDPHPLIEFGPYRYVRNPYYLSNLIEIIGLVLVAESLATMVLAAGIYVPLLTHRMLLEEKALQEKLGEVFCEYKRRVPLLIPRFVAPKPPTQERSPDRIEADCVIFSERRGN